jgi:hypothetical protein
MREDTCWTGGMSTLLGARPLEGTFVSLRGSLGSGDTEAFEDLDRQELTGRARRCRHVLR